MKIEPWECAGSLPLLYKELQELGLESNIAELEAFGFTVVPPEKVGPPGFHLEYKEALERIVADRFGPLDSEIERWNDVNDIMRFLLWDDPVFEKFTYHPVGLGLSEYLLGTNCILNIVNAWIKGPGGARTGIHGDYLDKGPDAMPQQVVNTNVHLMLTNYSKEEGTMSFLPGSHRWRRQASPAEAKYWADRAHPVNAPAGSMIVWGNHTWHGSYPRTVPGVRLTLQSGYMRPRYQPQEAYRETVTQEALDRNPIRFAGLMDAYGPYPFGKNDQIPELMYFGPKGTGHEYPTAEDYCSLFDTEPAKGKVTTRPDYDYHKHDGRIANERHGEAMAELKRRRELARKPQGFPIEL